MPRMCSAADTVMLTDNSRKSSLIKHFWESWLYPIIREMVYLNISKFY